MDRDEPSCTVSVSKCSYMSNKDLSDNAVFNDKWFWFWVFLLNFTQEPVKSIEICKIISFVKIQVTVELVVHERFGMISILNLWVIYSLNLNINTTWRNEWMNMYQVDFFLFVYCFYTTCIYINSIYNIIFLKNYSQSLHRYLLLFGGLHKM